MEVVVEPLMNIWIDFLPPICRQDVMVKGLEENKKLILQKIEETKAIGALNGQNQDVRENSEDMDADD